MRKLTTSAIGSVFFSVEVQKTGGKPAICGFFKWKCYFGFYVEILEIGRYKVMEKNADSPITACRKSHISSPQRPTILYKGLNQMT